MKVSVPSSSVNSLNSSYLSRWYVLASLRYATATSRRLLVGLTFKVSNLFLKSMVLSWVKSAFWGGEDFSGEGETKLGAVLGIDLDSEIFPSHSRLQSLG